MQWQSGRRGPARRPPGRGPRRGRPGSVGKLRHSIGQVFHAADEGQQRRVREVLDEIRRRINTILAEEG
jgi:hypothetical protein